MGSEEASLSAAITKNIEQALENKHLTRNELASRASIAKSTLYRNMNRPENFTIHEAGRIAEALDLDLIDILKETA